MFRNAAIALAFSLTATTAQADALSDRYLSAAERMSQMMLELVEQCAPALAGQLGDGSLSPAMRQSTLCTFEAVRAQDGEAAARKYVNATEEIASGSYKTFMELAEVGEKYPELQTSNLATIQQNCGALSAAMDSPLARAMGTNPAAMAACFEE